jgi:hypothetical protein
MADGIKKPHRFKSGVRAKMQMKALRYGTKADDPALSFAGMRGAIRLVMGDLQRAEPELFGEVGRIEAGVVRRLRQVLTQNSIRTIECTPAVLVDAHAHFVQPRDSSGTWPNRAQGRQSCSKRVMCVRRA